jgi:hypothetical protein
MQARRSMQSTPHAAPHAITRPAGLVLPAPPEPVPAADTEDPGQPRTATAAADTGRSAIPPPGGYPVDVLQEMWEAALLTPHKVSDTPLTAENWYITGVFTRGGQQQVIVQRGTDPKPHFHSVGDTLPGGARIAWVRPNTIGLVTPKNEQITLPLQR